MKNGRRGRLSRVLGALLLLGLFLVPVAASAHVHTGATQHATPCAVCTVGRHAPAVRSEPVLAPSLVPVVVSIYAEIVVEPGSVAPECRHGRAPPRA